MPGVFPNMPVLENVFIGSKAIKQFEKTRSDIDATLKKLTSFPYVIHGDKKEIESFVINNQLTNFLWEAVPHVRRIFGSDAQLYLELSEDPEGDFRELFIVIKTNHEINKALRLLERLDQEWFLSIVNRVGNCLNITVANHNEF
jgi:hypothetical protein